MSQSKRFLCVGSFSNTFDPKLEINGDVDVVQVDSPLRALTMVQEDAYDAIFFSPTSFGEDASFADLIRNERILEKMPDGVALLDSHNKVLWANRQFVDWSGGEDVLKKNFYELLDNPEILGPDYCPFHSAVSKNRATNSTLKVADQTFYQVHAAPIFEAQAEKPYLIVSVRDVSEETLQRQKLEAIHKAGLELADLRSDEILEMDVETRIELLKSNILHYTKDLLNFDVVEIRLLELDESRLEPLLSVGINSVASTRPLYARAKDNGVTGFVAATGKSYICEETQEDPLYIEGLDGARSCMTVPLILRDECIGTFNVESPDVGAFSDSDLQFVEIFSRDIASALNTLELLSAQQVETTQQSVEAIHSAVALPIDEILNDAVNVIEKYIGHEPEVVLRLQTILKNARDIKQLIQKVGEKMVPSVAVPPSQKCESHPDLRNARVLVVDDDDMVRHDAHKLLERFGCFVETAHKGLEAVSMVRNCTKEHEYDAIISAIKLPDMGGHDLMQKLQEIIGGEVPMILMTGFGYDPGHAIVKARRAGLRENAVLYKPFRLDQLLSTVEMIVKSCRNTEAS